MSVKREAAGVREINFKPKKDTNVRKQERLLEYLKKSKENKFTGYLKINYSQGNIGRIEKFEEILK